MATRQFGMHGNVFYLLVTKQAGTREKALLEAIMNSIDAGSPAVGITLTTTTMRIVDTGRGFTGDDEVRRYFSTVGTPHVAGDANYGRFRMGRLQLLRWGVNRWRSNEFLFEVDVKGRGREHDIHRGLPRHPGCAIEIDLYEPMQAPEVARLQATIAEWAAWSPVPVTVNGELASTDPASRRDWTIDHPLAWIRLDGTPELRLYNQGMFVASFGASMLGAGGVITTKPPPAPCLDLVYARNAVKAGCPVWRTLRAQVRAHTAERVRKRAMTADERDYHCERLMSGELPVDEAHAGGLRLMTMVDGTHQTVARLAAMAAEGLGCAESTDRDARSIHAARIGHVLDTATVERCGKTTLAELLGRLVELHTTALRRSQLRGARDHGIMRDDRATCVLRETLRDLERFKELDIASLRSLLATSATPVPGSLVPPGMQAYLRALASALAGHPGVLRVAAFHSATAPTATAGGTLFVNPPLMPNPAGGLEAAMRSAAILVEATVPTEGDQADGEANRIVRVANALADPRQGAAAVAHALVRAYADQAKHGQEGWLRIADEAGAFRAAGRQSATTG